MASKTLCVTGGATGADSEFANAAINNGTKVLIWTFKGHYMSDTTPTGVSMKYIFKKKNKDADNAIKIAAEILQRNTGKLTWYTRQLLRRNYAVAYDVNAMYAVGTFSK